MVRVIFVLVLDLVLVLVVILGVLVLVLVVFFVLLVFVIFLLRVVGVMVLGSVDDTRALVLRGSIMGFARSSLRFGFMFFQGKLRNLGYNSLSVELIAVYVVQTAHQEFGSLQGIHDQRRVVSLRQDGC